MIAPSAGTRAVELAVGIADLQIAGPPVRSIVTHALGSCVGVFVWDPETCLGGCLHYMLPKSDGSPGNPDRFADTGMARLIRGVAPDKAAARRLRIVACGGASMYEENSFRVGPRNIAALKQFLWNIGLPLAAHDLGGNSPRTARIDLASGRVTVDSSNTTIL